MITQWMVHKTEAGLGGAKALYESSKSMAASWKTPSGLFGFDDLPKFEIWISVSVGEILFLVIIVGERRKNTDLENSWG